MTQNASNDSMLNRLRRLSFVKSSQQSQEEMTKANSSTNASSSANRNSQILTRAPSSSSIVSIENTSKWTSNRLSVSSIASTDMKILRVNRRESEENAEPKLKNSSLNVSNSRSNSRMLKNSSSLIDSEDGDTATIASSNINYSMSIPKLPDSSCFYGESLVPRPATARSLPAKVQKEVLHVRNNLADYSTSQSSNLNKSPISTSSVWSPQPHSFALSQLVANNPLPQPPKIVNSITIKKENDENSSRSKHQSEGLVNGLKHRAKSSLSINKEQAKSDETQSNRAKSPAPGHANQESVKVIKNIKSNLDYYLAYSSNPFTTKFEIIGPPLSGSTNTSKTHLKPPQFAAAPNGSANAHKDLKLSVADSGQMSRSRSTSNISNSTGSAYSHRITSPNQASSPSAPNGVQQTKSRQSISSSRHESDVSMIGYNVVQEHQSDLFSPTHSHYEANDAKYGGDSLTRSKSEKVSSLQSSFLAINDHLFIGNVNSIKNERMLCRLGIEYLIDMSNMRPDDLNRKILGRLPCLCKQQHSRLNLSIKIEETNFKSLFNTFTEVNRFIQRARKSSSQQKSVLIFGKEIFAQPVLCACCQYLMVEYDIDFETAWQIVMQKVATTNAVNKYSLRLDKSYFEYLTQFERYLEHMSISLFGSAKLNHFTFNDDQNDNEDRLSIKMNNYDVGINYLVKSATTSNLGSSKNKYESKKASYPGAPSAYSNYSTAGKAYASQKGNFEYDDYDDDEVNFECESSSFFSNENNTNNDLSDSSDSNDNKSARRELTITYKTNEAQKQASSVLGRNSKMAWM